MHSSPFHLLASLMAQGIINQRSNFKRKRRILDFVAKDRNNSHENSRAEGGGISLKI
jgi:hypothetical protein